MALARLLLSAARKMPRTATWLLRSVCALLASDRVMASTSVSPDSSATR